MALAIWIRSCMLFCCLCAQNLIVDGKSQLAGVDILSWSSAFSPLSFSQACWLWIIERNLVKSASAPAPVTADDLPSALVGSADVAA